MDEMNTLTATFLGSLEEKESKFLTWGFINGGFTEEEIYEEAEEVLEREEEDEVTPDELVEEMLDRRLLFILNLNGRKVWRTRMAEAVRLFARLRQIFPGRRWEIAPTLVSDFRFALRDRRYPKRHIPAAKVLTLLEEHLDPLEKETLKALLDRGTFLLSDFQVRATRRMLLDLKQNKSSGMIVCAGTGTGKTLSFYLPALTHVSTLVEKNVFWTKALAIYPRNELLKDQFSETYQEAKRIGKNLLQRIGRKITIGAFFGDTPKGPYESYIKGKWSYDRAAGGYVCPYLRCPDCEGNLVWQQSDIAKKVERLSCSSADCDCVIEDDELLLTRDRMAYTPPDFLFTTTEMLNRQLTNEIYRHVFGVQARKSPHLMLLDEVHTYSGVSGAQVANLLRRWKHAVQSEVHFTGLSATLQDAGEFFSELVGLPVNQVEEISPGGNLISEGKEYHLILRGDPVSATSLLSTTIQASMLLGRILDTRNNPVSKGQYGQRTFIFTDDLDVTNRMFHNLLDAEGLNSQGRPSRGKRPLALIRATSERDNAQRLLDGQSWYLCEEIGHYLDQPRRIGRTSSQDTGVDAGSDLVVATASLEVGFNDPKVGAVLQHKAPRDMASYLQRKGRAGRPRGMRPWMVVVLSDYGRDRLAYQGYESLFDPVLEKRVLPVDNRYVLRMQTVYAFMEWVALQMPPTLREGSVWVDFSCPPEQYYSHNEKRQNNMRVRQHYEADLIEEVLRDPEKRQALEKHLKESLDISEEDLQAVLWSPPRALMTAVLPTLLRRLQANWKSMIGNEKSEYFDPMTPLPEFVPANLFSDLYLPEVTITTPPVRNGDEPEHHKMGIIQAMSTFAPGRVTRRFGVSRGYLCHWVAPPNLAVDEQTIPLEEFCTGYEEIGTFQYEQEGTVKKIGCMRPWEFSPAQPPKQVLPTSNAMLLWRSQILPAETERGLEVDLPHASPWLKIIQQVRFFLHNKQSAVQIRRFALGSEANLRLERGKEQKTKVYFCRENEAVGIGFTQAVDGVAFSFRIPEEFSISEEDPNKNKIRAFRVAYFRHRVTVDQRLDHLVNGFQRDWLCQVYLSILVTRAMLDESTLAEAYQAIQKKNLAQEMQEVLDVIFQTIEIEEPNETAEEDSSTEVHRQKVHQVLLEFSQDPTVTQVLHELAPLLWQSPDEEWHHWAISRFKTTLGGALLQACLELSPQSHDGDLYLDIDPGPRPTGVGNPEDLEEIWITETTSGGGGVIEEIFRRYSDDPRRFFRLVESVLGPSDFELVDSELTRLLNLTQRDSEITNLLASIRSVQGYRDLQGLYRQFQDLLMKRGILVTHPVISAINNRVLRPGSSAGSDRLLQRIVRVLHTEEERLGIEIDNRAFAYVFSRKYSDPTMFNQALSHIGAAQCADPHWRFLVVYGLLWPRGNTVRARTLQSYNPFARMPDCDRELVLDALHAEDVVVPLGNPSWRQRVAEVLSQHGVVRLYAESHQVEFLKKVMQELVVDPVDVGFLHLYPRVEGLQRDASGYFVTLDLREAVQ
ncbi:hypothetical protein JCM14036_12420 [Desulfotomaculum defluvii]